jgi:hypothetical protein
MAVPLIPVTFQNPGSKGLNTQDSTGALDASWATELLNAVFDNSGRIAARKGWIKLTTSGTPGAHNIDQLHCYEDGTSTVLISASNNNLYYGTTSLTSIKGALAPTANNWQFLNWNDGTNRKVLAWQASHAPIVSTVTYPAAVPGNFSAIAASTGSVPQGNAAMVGWGRVWASDSDNLIIKFSGLLNETQWASGGAGSFDTRYYWPKNGDFIVALAQYQDNIVVFGRRNILIYSGTLTPATAITLIDKIEGVGCVARDSVQSLGNDIIFLSETGLRTLSRTLTTSRSTGSKIPMQEVAPQARDEIVQYISGNETSIRSCFNVDQGFYLLVLPDSNDHVEFIVDLKGLKTQNLLGGDSFDMDNARVAKWSGWSAYSVAYGRNQVMYGGFTNTADSNNRVVGYYGGYLDNTSTYNFSWKSPWMDLGAEDGSVSGNFIKVPKEAVIFTVGGLGSTYTVTWGFDFSPIYNNYNIALPASGEPTAEWGQSGTEWGTSEWGYSTSLTLTKNKSSLWASGQVMRIGVSVPVDSTAFALQRIDIYLKKGRAAR